MKNIIIIAGGFLQLPLIQTARAMNLGVVVFDGDVNAPGFKIADHSIVCDITDAQICIQQAKIIHKKINIHGVITAGTDMSETVAHIAQALGLLGIDPADALAAKNKVLMRKRLAKAGILQPDFLGLWKFSEVHNAMDELGLPLVLKPAQNMGARGVIKIEKRESIYEAYRHSKKYSKTGELILEKFIQADEISVDALAWIDLNNKQQFKITGIADRIITGEPWFIETGHNMPSQKSPELIQKLEGVMKNAMNALGIHTGAGKGDLRITKDGDIYVGEIAARLSGGFMSSHTYPLSSGVDLLKNAILIAINGKPDDLKPAKNKIVIERSIIGEAGKIIQFNGLENMLDTKNIKYVFFMKKKGDVLQSLSNNIGKAGHIIAEANTLAEAEKSVLESLKHLELKVDDSFGLDWKETEKKARIKFDPEICIVCKVCDGVHCVSGIPGMGGPGFMNSFKDNIASLSEYKIAPAYVHNHVEPATDITFFGQKIKSPIMTAPMTGASTNLGNVISEYDLAKELLLACKESGSIAWLGDGASPEKYKTILKAIKDTNGPAILICKPRQDTKALIKRFWEARDVGVMGVGIDIDAISLRTLELRKLSSISRSQKELSTIRSQIELPFVLKGVLNVKDAKAALEMGADAIVVSNHGGRVLDEMPGTARVLPEISKVIQKKIPVVVDGGIRSGVDVFKMLALGADAILFGRMAAIAVVGSKKRGAKHLLRIYKEELEKTMKLCGIKSVSQIEQSHLINIRKEHPDHE